MHWNVSRVLFLFMYTQQFDCLRRFWNALLIEKGRCDGSNVPPCNKSSDALQVAKSSQPNSEAFERLIAWKKHKAVPNYCGQYADPGPCTSRVKRFYYDRDLGDCKEFTYSGCLGNSNNFETKESCKMVCIE
ncbi:hypothetical protein CRM22_010255 [Opisthorchis felineus]|uniref:BPTI/Kunitz inhibitor domain-containing protein n=1 Tax=Opisthorchis felineus TaxID=147828 RepID=A0A4S2L5R5_OPIFE|nr:hypothetical protein CRM22_010255 [Opisthorchis felineus]